MIYNNRKLIFCILTILITCNSLFSQTNKSKKCHEAIFNREFEKAEFLLNQLTAKKDELALTYFLWHEYYLLRENKKFSVDSAFYYFNLAYDNSVNLDLKRKESFDENFSFSDYKKEQQKMNIIEIAYEVASKDSSIQSFYHFKNYYGPNHLTNRVNSKIDKILFDRVITHNSIDSLYLFKYKYPNSQFFHEIDEQIVSLKLIDCKQKKSLDCLNSIKIEFPESNQVIIINEAISELSEQIATDRFENCKLIKSLECLDRIIAEFPTTKVINEIKVERDSMLFDLYCFSKKLDSVYSFLSLYKSSGFIKDAKLLFKRIFEDSITRLSSAIIFDNWESITTDFHLKFKTYLELNNCDENIKLKYESLFFNGLSLESSKNKIDWFLQEFPNSLNIYKIKEIDKIITLNDNVAFYKEKTGINQNKYGLLNMSSRNFLVDCFFEEVNKFCNGLAAVKLYGKWGFINKKGQMIIPFIYNEARNFNDNITGVELEGVWFFIDQNGYKVSENQYLYIGEFENGLVNVKPYTGGWIYIDNDEQIKSPTSYYNATSFRNNVAAVSTKAQEVLLIDQSFKILKDITEDLTYFIPYYGYQSESKDIISFYYSDKLKR